jgi:hypothetical protein
MTDTDMMIEHEKKPHPLKRECGLSGVMVAMVRYHPF